MARGYQRFAPGTIERRKQKAFDLQEKLRKEQNGIKAELRGLRDQNRKTFGTWMDREGVLDLPVEEQKSLMRLVKVAMELGLLSDPAEAERRLREPSGRSMARREDMLAGKSVAALASAAE